MEIKLFENFEDFDVEFKHKSQTYQIHKSDRTITSSEHYPLAKFTLPGNIDLNLPDWIFEYEREDTKELFDFINSIKNKWSCYNEYEEIISNLEDVFDECPELKNKLKDDYKF